MSEHITHAAMGAWTIDKLPDGQWQLTAELGYTHLDQAQLGLVTAILAAYNIAVTPQHHDGGTYSLHVVERWLAPSSAGLLPRQRHWVHVLEDLVSMGMLASLHEPHK